MEDDFILLTLIVLGGGGADRAREFNIENKNTFDRSYHSLTPF